MTATVIESKNLAETVIVSLVAGVGVTALFSVMIFSAVRLADLVRQERPLLATAAGALTALSFAAILAVVVVGIVVMAKK